MPNYSFELQVPGTQIDGLDDGVAVKAFASLQMMSTNLVDAAYALTAFEVSRAEVRSQLSAEDSTSNEDRRPAPPMHHEFLRRRPFIYATVFVHNLDMLSKHLGALEELLDDPAGVSKANEALNASVPDLKGVRNSIQHAEDRLRGRREGGKDIKAKPINKSGVYVPGGGLMVIGNLHDHLFIFTMANGELGEVPINKKSLLAAVDAVQTAIDSFAWRGWPLTGYF